MSCSRQPKKRRREIRHRISRRSLSCVANPRRTKRNPTSLPSCMDFSPTRSLSFVANPKRSKIRPTIPLESVRTAVHEVCVAVAFPSQRRSKIRHHIIPSMDLAIQNHSIETDPSFHLATDRRFHPQFESDPNSGRREPPTSHLSVHGFPCMDSASRSIATILTFLSPSTPILLSCQRRSKIRHRISPRMDQNVTMSKTK